MPAAVPRDVRKIYYATFIPGLRDLIAETVKKRLADAVIHRLLDGAILFETALEYDKLNFFCFNNIFAVADIMETTDGQGAIEAHADAVTRSGRLPPAAVEMIARNAKKFRTFRIVFARENTPAAADEQCRLRAERFVARLSGLTPDRSHPDAEFWFLYRSEGFSVFMKRLTLRPSWEKSLRPGELPPPLAWTLCRLGNLQSADVMLDPFCGFGSIPQAAFSHFHITRGIACDLDAKAAAYTAGRFKKHNGAFTVRTADFRALPDLLPARGIDAIVSDPPWGHYRENPELLYKEMFNVFDILLKPDGRLVILGARTGDVPDTARNRFERCQSIPILLSGKKAAIYVMRK